MIHDNDAHHSIVINHTIWTAERTQKKILRIRWLIAYLSTQELREIQEKKKRPLEEDDESLEVKLPNKKRKFGSAAKKKGKKFKWSQTRGLDIAIRFRLGDVNEANRSTSGSNPSVSTSQLPVTSDDVQNIVRFTHQKVPCVSILHLKLFTVLYLYAAAEYNTLCIKKEISSQFVLASLKVCYFLVIRYFKWRTRLNLSTHSRRF